MLVIHHIFLQHISQAFFLPPLFLQSLIMRPHLHTIILSAQLTAPLCSKDTSNTAYLISIYAQTYLTLYEKLKSTLIKPYKFLPTAGNPVFIKEWSF